MEDMQTFDAAVKVMLLIAAYLIPSIVAGARKHHASNAILIVNLFLGWTFVGWVVALAWSAGPVRKP